MSFMNELMPESEKNRLSFQVETRPDGSKPTLWKWTVDRERDAFLVFTGASGGSYEGVQTTFSCVLSLSGRLFKFFADPYLGERSAAGQVMRWVIHDLEVPDVMGVSKEELMEIIREAFDVIGHVYDRNNYAFVKVEFRI